MPWLWFAGPLTFIFLAVVFGVWPSAEERRLKRELSRWIRAMLGSLPGRDDDAASRLVQRLPTTLSRLVDDAGGGSRIADVVLVPKHAYLAVRAADAHTASNQYTVVCRLARPAPRLLCKPLAIVDGRPVENDGLVFKDTEFMDHYVVEGADARAVKKWLRRDVREALMQFPDLWLQTDGKTLALTFHGYADAEMLDELIEVADIIFAERGAGGGAPLFGDADETGTYRNQPEKVRRPVVDADAAADDDEQEPEELASLQDRVTAGVIDFSLYLIGVVFTIAVLGHFPGFHPSVLFNSPDLTVAEPWQGGWTTKGFGALVAVESYLVGLVALQAHLAVRRGQSLGKLLMGVRVDVIDGSNRTFTRTVFLRKWLFAVVPLIAAAIQARPFSARGFFNHIPTKITVGVAAATGLAVAASWIVDKQYRGVHDRVAGTEVVACERYRLPTLQLGMVQRDPLVVMRIVRGAFLLVAFIIVNLVTYKAADAWFLEVYQWK